MLCTVVHVVGTIQFTLDFNNLTVPVTFCVLEHLHHDIILGMNFFKQTNANIDIPSKVVTLYDGLVGVNLTRPADIVLRTVDAVLIPPRSEALIPVSAPPHYGSVLSIIEPSVKLSNKNLALAGRIVIPRHNRTACKILNPTDVPIFLRLRRVIGVIDKISIESINIIENLLPSDCETKEETSPIILDDQLKVISQKAITLDQNDLSADKYKTLVKVLYDNNDLFAIGMHDLVGTDVVKWTMTLAMQNQSGKGHIVRVPR